MSESHRPSEETQTEFIPQEAPPATRELSGPPPSPTPRPSVPETDLESTQESAAAYPSPSAESGPPTAAFVPPELMARRRAAAPPSAPYQPIAGWSVAPPASTEPGQTGAGQPGPVEQNPAPGQFTDPTRAPAQAAAPANGFAAGPSGSAGQAGPASASPAAFGTGPGASPPRSSGTPGWLLAVVAVAVIAVIAAIWIVLNGQTDDNTEAKTAKPTPTAAAEPVELDAQLSTFDPTPEGRGFRDRDGVWTSSTYNTVAFGNLKKGIGMVLDLGSAKAVDTVTFTDKSGPLDVELRAADEIPNSISGWDEVGKPTTSSGKTSLDASDGGKHRYWLIWVTKLGPSRQGVLTDISAKG